MDAKELRIGNWVKCVMDDGYTTQTTVTHLPNNHWADYDIGTHITDGHFIDESFDVEPIPLTEEWLERFGFENRNRDYFKGSFCVQYADRIFDHNNIFFFGYNGNSIEIKYVHQLQNLYFALTGEELNQNK